MGCLSPNIRIVCLYKGKIVMKTIPRNIQMGAVGFIAAFLVIYLLNLGPVLALVVGAVVFALFYLGIIKMR